MHSPANTASPTRSQRLYTNGVLTVIAGLLLAMTLDRAPGSLIQRASAQPRVSAPAHSDDSDDSGRVSAAEQRKVIIAELRTLDSRLEAVEGVLNKGLSVKVTEMPPIQFPSEKDKADKKDDRKAAAKQ